MPENIGPSGETNTKDPEWIRCQFRRQLGRVLVLITAPLFLLAILVVILFYGFEILESWFIWPLLVASGLGGLIGGSLLRCPNCGIRQPFRTGSRFENKCRRCGAVLC